MYYQKEPCPGDGWRLREIFVSDDTDQKMHGDWHVVDPWREPLGGRAGLFTKVEGDFRSAVLAVRGTEDLSVWSDYPTEAICNSMDDVYSETKAKRLSVWLKRVMEEVAQRDYVLNDQLHLYAVAHSIGASALSIAYGRHYLCWSGLRCFSPPVLFDSPGVPEQELSDIVTLAAKLGPQKDLENVRFRTKEILGAPNQVNTLNEHFGRHRYRLMIPHGQKADSTRVMKCLPGTAGRLTLFATLSRAATSTAAVVAPYYAFGRLLGLSDENEWLLQQHSMDSFCKGFEVGAEQKLVFEWPSGATLAGLAYSTVTSAVPFHPGNFGIHNLSDADALVERRIEDLVGYSTQDLRPSTDESIGKKLKKA